MHNPQIIGGINDYDNRENIIDKIATIYNDERFDGIVIDTPDLSFMKLYSPGLLDLVYMLS